MIGTCESRRHPYVDKADGGVVEMTAGGKSVRYGRPS